MRVLCWPGMPAAESLAEASRRTGLDVGVEAVTSNELLEERMQASAFDLVFPSDYLVERLVARGQLHLLSAPRDALDPLVPWARDAPHDPGCRFSLPFAFGTTGYLCDERVGASGSWDDLFLPPPGLEVGMLAEVREVLGAALIAGGDSPNEVGSGALERARALLLRQRPFVTRYDSDDFVGPVVRGEVAAHQAWSGPAAGAVRTHPGLRYVVPVEGAGRWITTGAIPSSAPNADAARRLLIELAAPDLAALTTATEGFATPSNAARDLLPSELRDDAALFPPDDVLQRCTAFHDLGRNQVHMARIFDEVVAAG